jgi:hypothetical protein
MCGSAALLLVGHLALQPELSPGRHGPRGPTELSPQSFRGGPYHRHMTAIPARAAGQVRRPSPLGYGTLRAEDPVLARGHEMWPGSVVVVVEAAGDDGHDVVLDVVHEPVLLGDPA